MVRKPLILVVDDDEILGRNLSRLIQARGFEVLTTLDGYAALQQLDQSREAVDAVLLDLRMTGMDGLETLRRIKSTRDVPVIILTGHADVDSGVESIRQGAFDFLIKPCPIDDLADKLRSACNLGHIRRKPLLWPRATAGELLLHSFVKLYPDDPLTSALALFSSDQLKMAAETLFVVDRQDRLTGLITRNALMEAAREHCRDVEITWELLCAHPEWLPPADVGKHMAAGVKWVAPEQDLQELARTMMARRFRSMPVVAQERMIGIVRLTDVLRYLQFENRMEE